MEQTDILQKYQSKLVLLAFEWVNLFQDQCIITHLNFLQFHTKFPLFALTLNV